MWAPDSEKTGADSQIHPCCHRAGSDQLYIHNLFRNRSTSRTPASRGRCQACHVKTSLQHSLWGFKQTLLGRGRHLMYRKWLAEINLVFHAKELQCQGARGSSRPTQHSGNLSRQLGPVGWRRPSAGVKVGGPREAVENGHAHVLPPSWRENHTSHVPSATGQRHHALN